MRNYQIKLTPVEYYFFGGEKHNADLSTDYFVESLDYPQQTTILGLVRYYLLLKNNLLGGKSLPANKQNEAQSLIGEKSFSYGDQNVFGKIKTISPLYFSHQSKGDYVFGPKNVQFSIDKSYNLTFEGKPYNYKDHGKEIDNFLLHKAGTNAKIKLSDLIKDYTQVGNEKYGNENAFYKQTMKKLESGWSFVVDLELDLQIENDECFIPFGGEKSFFKLELITINKVEQIVTDPNNEIPGLYLLSDAFVDPKELKDLPFAITENVSFRNLLSRVSTKNFYALDKAKNIEESIVRSSRYNLLKRGSVLYFKSETDRNSFKQNLEKADCYKIGFNYTKFNS